MSERGEAILGTILDARYRVEAVLGPAHADGTVFRGRDAAAGATVVIRCPAIPEGLAGAALTTALDAFVEEASLLARIGQGSNDVEKLLASGVADRGTEERVPYTVFEWLAGRSLERHIAENQGGASIGEALVILEPAARALAATHALGVAHRDVRPANLWLAELGGRTTLKVAAFGLATRVGPGDSAFAPEYGAPEHFKKSYGAIGPATDVYGLALCIIELVTGRRALEGRDAGELYLATSDLGRRPTLRARGAHVSDAVESVLQRALAVDPRRRWQSARELWDALISAVPELTPAAPSVRMMRASDRPPGLGNATRPGMQQDSGPASVPPGLAALARAAEAGVPNNADGASADKSGTKAWLAVAVLGVVAIALVVAKLGSGGPAPKAPDPNGDSGLPMPAAAPGSSAAPGSPASSIPSATVPKHASNEEQAVTVRPFLADMVKVPAGRFAMGSDHDGKGEKPPHVVRLTHAFYMDRTEVRADAYAACVEDGTCSANKVHAGDVVEPGNGCNTDKDRPTHPANCIDRVQAEKYCAFVSKRLPTEAEWEYAARGTDGREFPWGNGPPTTCTKAILTGMSGDCGERKGTWEVGTTVDGKSPFGLLDMAGNVWEWVADGYEPYASGEGGAALADPKVALAPGGRGVLRGGSWDYSVTSAKVSYRLPFATTSGNVSTGFRCARDAE